MPSVKFRRVIQILKSAGFKEDRVKGSHTQYEGVVNGVRRLVTVQTGHVNDDVKRGTLKSIIRQSGLDPALFK